MSDNDTPETSTVPAPVRWARKYNARYVESYTVPHATGGSETYRLKEGAYTYIANLARSGHSRESIRLALGLGSTSWKRLQTEDPKLVDALLAGNAGLELELTTAILTEVRKGNWIAALALGKVRGWRDSGPDANTPVNQVQVNISIPAPLPASEVMKIIGPIPDKVIDQ